jgi:hypothetical protein
VLEGKTVADRILLSDKQVKEGYWVEHANRNVLVWHNNCQIALLIQSPDINRKVQDVVEGMRAKYKEIEKKTGWKQNI